jgi:hypothetical protein
LYVDGYSINYADDMVWTSQDPTNYELDLTMSN